MSNQVYVRTNLGQYHTAVVDALTQLKNNNIMRRIWDKDHTVWREDPTEISNRLGWLDSPTAMLKEVDDLTTFAAEIKKAGFTDVLLLGMGGSSLAPELFSFVFGPQSDGLNLSVLDSTDPGAVAALTELIDPAKTLFIVATKSGGTAETHSFFKHFYNVTAAALGADKAGQQFVAITDPGSKLVTLAEKYGFRRTFINDPNIGGRYSVLSHFGLVPAALVGADVRRLLESAQAMQSRAEWAAEIGAIMGELAKVGRDKLTFFLPDALQSFGDWSEQLIAESVGKEGHGILPVVREPYGTAEVYGHDRLFVQFKLGNDAPAADLLTKLEAAGHPVVQVALSDRYDLGGQFLLWELATAVAGHLLDIQPFDQPNVEEAKIAARKMITLYEESGAIPPAETSPATPAELQKFLAQVTTGSYIALQAYVTPTAETTAALHSLQTYLRDTTHTAVTIGYGPRFLHSTGQLHKGDAGNGLFIQFVADAPQDVPIPDEAGSDASAMPFGVLIRAQALGDGQALQEAGRPLIRFDLTGDVPGGIRALMQ